MLAEKTPLPQMCPVTELFVLTGDLVDTAARGALNRSELSFGKKALLLTELTIQ